MILMNLLTDYSFVAVKQEDDENHTISIKDEVKIESEIIINDDENTGGNFDESKYELNLKASDDENITVDEKTGISEGTDADFGYIKRNDFKIMRAAKLEGRLVKKKQRNSYNKRSQIVETTNSCQKNNRFSCNICSESFTFSHNLERHKKRAHSVTQKVFKCNECDNTFKCLEYVKDHKNRVHSANQQVFKCNECDKTYLHQNSLKDYNKCANLVIQEVFNCNKCGKTCKHLGSLKDHKNVSKKIIKCDLCDFVASNKSKLNRHVAYRHINHHRKDFICETCKKSFSTAYHLHDHERRHRSKNGPAQNSMNYYICDICNKNFSSKKDITDHIKMHIGMKDNVCLTCKRAFVTKSHLIRHERKKKMDSDCGDELALCAIILMVIIMFVIKINTQKDQMV